MGTLPGWAIDLLHDGVSVSGSMNRGDVHLQMRRVMLAAHRQEIGWPTMQAALTNVERYKLAQQIAYGRNGKLMSPTQVQKILYKAWEETGAVVAKGPARTRDDALNIIEEVRVALDASVLPDDHRRVMEAAITIAGQKGTTRPTLPVRAVADLAKLSKSKAGRILGWLSDDGDWLRIAQRGNYKTGRASTYNLAPRIAATYAGATPPESRGLPKSHPPKSHFPAVGPDGEQVLQLTAEEIADIMKKRAVETQEQASNGQHKTAALAQVVLLRPPRLAPELDEDWDLLVAPRTTLGGSRVG